MNNPKSINNTDIQNKVYYLEFNTIEDPLIEEQIEEEMLLLLKDIMTPNECYECVIFGENDSIFLFIDEQRVNRIVERSKEMGILKSIKEISEDILINKYIDENFQSTFTENKIHSKLLSSYITNNLTPDLVLDKINEKGMASLNEFDHYILTTMDINDDDNIEPTVGGTCSVTKKSY